ncbi:MAG TPA: FAD-dependent oxidoreductase [Burkholderiales bacterium]|jgi:glycerol-3-phosphate dehydrogenase
MLERRATFRDAVANSVFDVAVIGGGINGASAYAELCRRGYRALLIDRGDFGGGSSQSSAMWIWGGLIYLATLDFPTVIKLCASRDQLIRQLPDWVRPSPNRYVATREDHRAAWFVKAALWLYWGLGAFRRRMPLEQGEFPERHLFRDGHIESTLLYEEASIFPSDARFVARWILPWCRADRPALNYCEVMGGGRDAADGDWRIEMYDRVTGQETEARARWVVNAAGVWTDELNQRFGIETAWKHVFSKGVFLALPRDSSHATPLTFENRLRDCYSLIPWGPVSLWGPTETLASDPESGFVAEPQDVRVLLEELNRHVTRPYGPGDIVALRCGVRALAVKRGYASNQYTLCISRRHVVARDGRLPWVSLYGGKLSSCISLGAAVADAVGRALTPARPDPGAPLGEPPRGETERFPGLEHPVPSARSAVEAEGCCTLEDYLRRRTNIAQWVPRHGLGRGGEHALRLAELAGMFPGVDGVRGAPALAAYEARVAREFDRVLAAV